MGIVALVVILALIFGGIGLFVKAAWWAFVIAVALLAIGVLLGVTRRGGAGRTPRTASRSV